MSHWALIAAVGAAFVAFVNAVSNPPKIKYGIVLSHAAHVTLLYLLHLLSTTDIQHLPTGSTASKTIRWASLKLKAQSMAAIPLFFQGILTRWYAAASLTFLA
jgi:hypothetical protein